MALLKELPTISGDININGRISYASQEPWVFSGTIRQNITFGKEFNQKKFDKILNVCSLDKVGWLSLYFGIEKKGIAIKFVSTHTFMCVKD